MSDPNWGDELERDLTRFITSTALLVENAVDALQVLWLVECGVLPVMKKPLTKEQSQCLGHGNVMVWLDRKPESLDIVNDIFHPVPVTRVDIPFHRLSMTEGYGNFQSGEECVISISIMRNPLNHRCRASGFMKSERNFRSSAVII